MKDRLRNIATQVLSQAAAEPPEWYGEWLQWLHAMLGPPPDASVGSSSHDEYKVFAMGSLLSWGYFAAAGSETNEETEEGETAAGGPGGGVGRRDGGPGAGVPGGGDTGGLVLVNEHGNPIGDLR